MLNRPVRSVDPLAFDAAGYDRDTPEFLIHQYLCLVYTQRGRVVTGVLNDLLASVEMLPVNQARYQFNRSKLLHGLIALMTGKPSSGADIRCHPLVSMTGKYVLPTESFGIR